MIFSFRKFSLRSPIVAVSAALLSTLFFLHDVVFMGRSLLPADYANVLKDEAEPRKPDALWSVGNSHESFRYRRYDIGAGAWQFEPSLHFMTRAMWERQTPYWNPHVATGALGPETLVDMKFSVVTLATAVLGGGTNAFHFVFLVIVFLSSYSVIRISACYFDLTGPGVIAALAAFLLGGYVQLNLIAPFLIFIYFATPIVLHTLFALAREQSAGRFLLATFANVMLFSFSFTPVMVLAAGFAHAICLIFILTEIEPGRRLRAFALADLAAPGVAILLVAPLYLPTIASFGDTTTLDFYLNRHFHGFRLTDAPQLLVSAGDKPWDMPTLGAIPFLLAVAGMAGGGPHRAMRWALLLASALGLAVAFRIWPMMLLEDVPILRTIHLRYWSYLYCMPVAFLVGFGVSAITRGNWSTIPVLIAATAAIAAYSDFILHAENAPRWMHGALAVAAALLAAALLSLAAACDRRLTRIASYVLVLLLIADGLYSTNFVRPARLDKGTEPPAVIAWVRDELGAPQNGRVLNIGRSSLYPDWADALGIAQVGTMNPSELRWFSSFYKRYIGNEWNFLSLGRNRDYVPPITDDVLDLLGVRFIIVDREQLGALTKLGELQYRAVREDGIRLVFENTGYLRRAFVVGAVVEAHGIPGGSNAANRVAATTTDRKLLAAADALGVSRLPRDPVGNAKIRKYRNGSLRVRVDLHHPGILVLMDAWHPGWTAMVDGKEAYIGLVNGAFRGIALPPGRHWVTMRYRPRLFLESLVASGIGGIVLIGVASGLWRQRRKDERTRQDQDAVASR